MSRAASIHARIDPTLKHDAEKILHQLGLNTSQALKLPNEETLEAMKELDSGKVKTYESMKDLWDEIDND